MNLLALPTGWHHRCSPGNLGLRLLERQPVPACIATGVAPPSPCGADGCSAKGVRAAVSEPVRRHRSGRGPRIGRSRRRPRPPWRRRHPPVSSAASGLPPPPPFRRLLLWGRDFHAPTPRHQLCASPWSPFFSWQVLVVVCGSFVGTMTTPVASSGANTTRCGTGRQDHHPQSAVAQRCGSVKNSSARVGRRGRCGCQSLGRRIQTFSRPIRGWRTLAARRPRRAAVANPLRRGPNGIRGTLPSPTTWEERSRRRGRRRRHHRCPRRRRASRRRTEEPM